MKSRDHFLKLLCSIIGTLEVFPTMNSCLGPLQIKRMERQQPTPQSSGISYCKTATHELHCMILITMCSLLHES